MSQKTNLNVLPYFDDFDPNKNFYRVLFKPGFPVQSRELTTLQSILQNQIQSFGSHIFKDGSVVVPGNVTYNSKYYAVKINPTHVGLSVGLYLNQLVGKRIRGQSSQLSAIVQNVLTNTEVEVNVNETVKVSETGDYTLYVKYTSSDSDFEITQFRDGETLILEESITYGNTTIASGNTFATLINLNASLIGSSVSISKGVYFIRGHFVNVQDNTLILDQYTNTPSYRVGLFVDETLVDAKEDNSLYDNASGFSNYAAPGADRLKISATLTKKRLTDTDDKNFVEILRVKDGVVKKIQDSNTYSLIKEYFAKRTYEESGNYSVDPFSVDISDSLNDRVNSDGVFYSTQKTEQGNNPSESLLAVKVSPGKAYVRGFDVEKSSTTIIDLEKSRDTATVSSSSIPFEMGNLLKVSNVSGTPAIGIDNNFSILLNSRRKDSTIVGAGVTIGTARVYSFGVSDAPYANSGTSWDLYLYDIQTYTTLTLNQSLSSIQCPETSYIKGLNSGASGYVIGSPFGSKINIQQTSGSFSVGEPISINGKTEHSRAVSEIKIYGAQDIKSVYQDKNVAGLTTSFIADTVLQSRTALNFSSTDTLSISAGVATCAGKNFVGVKTDTIIRYQRTGFTTETYNRVSSVSSDGLTMTLVGVATVAGICDGQLPTSSVSATFSLGVPSIQNEERAFLYAKLNSKNISDVNLASSDLTVNRQVTKSTSNVGSVSITLSDVGITSAFFEPYDSERYSVFYEDGTIDQLTADKVGLSANSTTLDITGLRTSQSNVKINVTVRKNSIKNKQKNYIRSQKIEINSTSSGISTVTSGLTTNSFYGLRVEDEEISLNVPDVANVVAVYESLNNSYVQLDSLTFGSGLNLDTSSILGEKIIGQSSGAVGQLVTRSSSTQVEFVYLNSNKFSLNETVIFEESNIIGSISTILIGKYTNKTQDFILDKGQKEQYYDYSRIVRRKEVSAPSRRLLVIYDSYVVPQNDSGDLYTVKSYDSGRYKKDIPLLKDGVRSSDVLDFRPRVSNFTTSSSSPFAFQSRNFAAAGSNPTLVVAPNESSVVGYSYYLPRIDKLVLNKNGLLNIIKGVSSPNPKEPVSIEDAMDLAKIELPAYLYDPKDARVTLSDNKRYTMRDIRSLENRVENIEKATSLSLLELNTQSLQILDSDGISRFKTGFFVDDFKSNNFIDIENIDAQCTIDLENEELLSDVSSYSLKSQVSPAETINTETIDFSSNFSLLDQNVKKTGNVVTLNYSEIEWTNLSQNFATREEQVNPFGVSNFNGNVKLTPSSDTWVRTVNSESGIILRTQSNWQNTFISNLLPSSSANDRLRSRNIEFRASGLQPLTNYYSFFGGSANIDIIPKLLKVSIISGVFSSGEIVSGFIGSVKVASFRVANSNHKSGAYGTPSSSYAENPYASSTSLSTYSSSSTVLNVDTFSLADDADGRFYGYTPAGMRLVGETSGAQANVETQTLTTDSVGDLIGCIFIRNPLANPAPPSTFSSGSKTFKLSSSSTNSSSSTVSFTETTFYDSGIVNSNVYTESIVVRRPPSAMPLSSISRDPLSQTFRSDSEGGFLTSVDLYFAGKDSTEKLFVEIRETDIGGTPKEKLIQNFARAEISPSGITTSSDGSAFTNIKFESPIYLQPDKQYAISLISPSSDDYKVWIARSTEVTVDTQTLPNAQQVIYSNQYVGGNLFKSQNGSIWSPSIYEDLKFKFYKSNFTSTTGTAYFHNPPLSIGSTYASPDANIQPLILNPIKTLPRKIVVGINTSSNLQNIFTSGMKVSEGDTYGYVENLGGPIGVITTTNVGAGYSNGTFSNVPLYTITGSGNGAKATVTILGNTVASVSVANTGTGYKQGDLLGITTSSITRGRGSTITVSNIWGVDTIFLTDVVGEDFTNNNVISYYPGSTAVSLGGTVVSATSTILNDLYSGNVFEVAHYNHGMHSSDNVLTISGVFPNTPGESLTANVTSANTTLSIANTSNFTTFEGKPVSGSNPGYVLVNNEVISYSEVSTNSLTILNRGVNQSITRNHAINDAIYKYELNGVSLSRINTSHTMPSNLTLKNNRGIDNYHIQFSRTGRSSGDDMLNFTTQSTLGGSNCRASQNIQFNQIIPQFNVITPDNTNVSSLIRTVSGTSSGGSEISFLDQGFEDVSLNNINNLSSTRLVCSRVNEINKIPSLPRSRSLTLGIKMETSNSNVSPVIDLTEASTFVLNRNRINKPISNYINDSRVNGLSDDPHSSVYISKKVNLTKPASSLKVYLTANRPSSSDFRVLYRLFRSDSSEINQSFDLFPGYANLTDSDGDGLGDTIIDTYLNDGSSDAFINFNSDDEYSEYQYTANNLEQFNGFIIKIVMNGTNEAYYPKFKDLRVIALA